jgi:hypothetical protein
VGSSPIIRFKKAPETGLFRCPSWRENGRLQPCLQPPRSFGGAAVFQPAPQASSCLAVTLSGVTVLAVVVAALGGGIVAAWVGSWFERLAAFEDARLIVLAELMGDLASHHALDITPPEDRLPVVYSTSAWVTHRERLAVRAQRHPDLWSAVGSFYTVVGSTPGFGGLLEQSMEESATFAVANFDLLELSTLELVPVYGPRRAWRMSRERRRRLTLGALR